MIDKCLTKAAGELGVEEVSEADAKAIADTNSQTLSNVIFTQRKGKRGYDERQVDYYLAACAQLLTRLESYARARISSANPPKRRWPRPHRPLPRLPVIPQLAKPR